MITIVINGQNYDYPQVGDTEWGDAATTAMQALATTTLQPVKDLNDPTAVNNFTLYNDINFGNTNGLRVLFVESNSNNPALSGVFRLCNGELVAWRNGNNDNDNSISFDASDNFVINGNTISFDVNGEMLVNGVQVTRSGEIVNADVAAAAGIEESKLALDHGTTALYNNIENHKADTNNPHDTTVSNLDDTNIISASDEDTLMYDQVSTKWINRANTVDNLKNVNITSVQDGQIMTYDSNNTEWINTTNSVDNLSNVSITSVQDKNILAYDSNDSLWKNIDNSVNNLAGVSVTTPVSGQVLTYDGSNWTNQPSASASLAGLTDTTITTPANGDTLLYNSVSTKWENSDKLTTVDTNLTLHTTNTSNPHSTTVSNLDDTTITTPSDQDTIVYDNNSSKWINQENSVNNLTNVSIDSNTLAVGDALVFDDQDSLWKNNSSFINHIGNAANPHLTTVAKLTDATISTPANNDVLLYDYANSQWINSSIIEINDIANINTATTNITLTASDKRHQIFTATDGFNITLPSTGIKAGERFEFEWLNDFGLSITNPFVFYSSDNTAMKYAWINNFNYFFTAKVDNPTLDTDWDFHWIRRVLDYHVNTNRTLIVDNASSIAANTTAFYTYKAGRYLFNMWCFTNIEAFHTTRLGFYLLNSNDGAAFVKIVNTSSDNFGIDMKSGYMTTDGTYSMFKPYSKTGIVLMNKKANSIVGRCYAVYTQVLTGTIYLSLQSELIDPVTDNSIT